MPTLGDTLSTTAIPKADLSDVDVNAAPRVARIGLGQAANTYRLSLPAATSATGGFDIGGDIDLYRVSAGKLRVKRPSGGNTVLDIDADTGNHTMFSLSLAGSEKWRLWHSHTSDGNLKIHYPATGRDALLFGKQDGIQASATFSPVHDTATDLPGHSVGLTVTHTIDNVQRLSAYQQIRSFSVHATVGGTGAVRGTPIAGSLHTSIKGTTDPTTGTPSTAFNETAYLFASATDETTDATPANHVQMWGIDSAIHGPIGVQNGMMGNANFHINNYFNGSPTKADSMGCAITTGFGKGAGGTVAHQAAQTYPVDVGLCIVGTSGTTSGGTQRIGFTTAIRVGGERAFWWTAGVRSRIGTGIAVEDYETYGIRIWKRSTVGATSPPAISIGWDNTGAASTAAHDGLDFANEIKIYRANTNVLVCTQQLNALRNLVTGTGGAGFLQFVQQSSDVAAPADTGVRVYARRKGGDATKDELVVRFETGPIKVLAFED